MRENEGGVDMALIKCTECGKEISDKATACPHCGCPMTEISNKRTATNRRFRWIRERSRDKETKNSAVYCCRNYFSGYCMRWKSFI